MPAGVPLERYVKFMVAALASMMAGAQVIHFTYRPLDDLPEFIESVKQKKLREKLSGEKDSPALPSSDSDGRE